MSHEGSIVMPFGKFQGKPLADLPTGYLDWLIGQDDFKRRDPDLYMDILAHLRTRADWKSMGLED